MAVRIFRGPSVYRWRQINSPQNQFHSGRDEHEVLLGNDTGANPVEHLLHALASCVTTSMVYHAAARGIAIDQVESLLEGISTFADSSDSLRKFAMDTRASGSLCASS